MFCVKICPYGGQNTKHNQKYTENLEKMFKHLLPLIIALNELLTMDI